MRRGWRLLAVLCYGLALREGAIEALTEGTPAFHRLCRFGWGLASLLCLWQSVRPRKESAAHGSAGFLSPAERRAFHLPYAQPLPPGAALLGVDAGKFVALPAALAGQHGVIVGGSGTGKTYSYFLPNAAFARGVSCVFTDPKSELWRYTSGFHAACRYAPCEPEASEAFNWVPLCRQARIAELCARAIVESGNTQYTEQIWLDMETAFLSALFSHASLLTVPTPLSAYRLFTRQRQETLLGQLLASPSDAAREQATIFQQTQEKLRGSVVPSVAAKLQFLRDDAVARFTSATLTAPDFGQLRRRALALYWCLNEADIIRLRPLSSLFFTLLLEQLCAEEGNTAVPVQMFLEEFANIGVIPHFETVISLARGRGLRLFLGIQSLSQLEARYGKPNAQTILTNCATKVALSGLDVETAQYFSRTLGPQTVVLPRRALSRRYLGLLPASVQETTSEHARPLLTADEIRRLPTEEALVIAGNHRAMVLRKYFYRSLPVTALAPGLGAAQTVPVDMETGLAAGEATRAKSPRKKGRPPPMPPELREVRPRRREKSQPPKSPPPQTQSQSPQSGPEGRWRPRALRGGGSVASAEDITPPLHPANAGTSPVAKRSEETG